MAASEKVHMISTKYFRGINQGQYVIYLQNMEFMQLILWPGGVYTDGTYATTVATMIQYYDSFHESRLCRLIMVMPNEPKSQVPTFLIDKFPWPFQYYFNVLFFFKYSSFQNYRKNTENHKKVKLKLSKIQIKEWIN